MRAHPAKRDVSGIPEGEKFLNVTAYEDMTELLLVADMLITDYSTSAGDFVLQNKPVILFQYDRKQYESKDRHLRFKMEDSPYWVAETQEELEEIIRNLTEQNIKDNCEKVLDFYGSYESGDASMQVAKIIAEHLD